MDLQKKLATLYTDKVVFLWRLSLGFPEIIFPVDLLAGISINIL